MKYLSGKALIALLELADFELFTLAAAGVIPVSPLGIPLETPRSAVSLEKLKKHINKRVFRIDRQQQVLERVLEAFPETWAEVDRGQGDSLVRSVLLTGIKEAMFPVEQLPEHYRKAIGEREAEAKPAKRPEVEELIKLALPEVEKLYALATSKEQLPHGITNTVNLSAVFRENALAQWQEHQWTYLTRHSLEIDYNLSPGQLARDFRKRVLQRILSEHGFVLPVSKVLEVIQTVSSQLFLD
jgi:hypothetical protein